MEKVMKKIAILALSAVLALMTFMSSLTGVKATMQPIDEINAFLVLTDVSEEELANYPVSKMLQKIQDKDGNYIPIDENAEVIWTYFKDDQDKVIRDEYHLVDRNETVDLSVFGTIGRYRMELIIGSFNQLDPANDRYIINVIVSDTEYDNITYAFYKQNADGSRFAVPTTKTVDTVGETGVAMPGIPDKIREHANLVADHEEGTEYYLGIYSERADNPNVRLHVYTFLQYMMYLMGGSAEEITDQILCNDMTVTNAGYKGTFPKPHDVYEQLNADGALVFVYEDLLTNKQIISAEDFYIAKQGSYIEASLNYMDGETETDATLISTNGYEPDLDELSYLMDGESYKGPQGVYIYNFMLKEGLPAEDEYYVYLNAYGADEDYGEEANSKVVKAVEGIYDSLEAASACEDIKDQLIPADHMDRVPYGFKVNCSTSNENGGSLFTVFFEDESVFKLFIRCIAYDPSLDPDFVREFTEDPIVGEEDPWFKVTGLMLDGKVLDTYVIENGKAINMDTYYGYGYQTIMVNQTLSAEEKARLVPIFEVADPDRLKVRLVRESEQIPLISGETEVDFNTNTSDISEDKGLVHLVLDFDNNTHVKNYQLRVLAKESGPKLYVYDDHKELIDGEVVRSREVLLTDYFENKHDILIANIGDAVLTGLSVKLEPVDEKTPMNVKLDDYWTIGGDNNSTLSPFESTTDMSAYGMIPNVAKVRLLPDGEGEINAKLVISADGQEDIVVYLSDHARQPKIVYDELPDGVKYVPYSAYVITDNMYDWNPQTFAITSGTLPPGLKLLPTGEIYGVPTVEGPYTFTVTASFGSEYFEDASQEITLVIKDNTDDNVFEASDGTDPETNVNYEIKQPIGTEESQYHYVVDEADAYEDQVFVSNGNLGDFVGLWLNGVELTGGEPGTPGVDYTYESGSSIITIKGQTFGEKSKRGEGEQGRNTIAMEFRNDEGGVYSEVYTNPADSGDHNKDLRRTSQNYYIYSNTTPVDPTPVLPQNVTLTAHIIDETDAPLADANLELHSTVQYGVTDKNGNATFKAVEFGAHQIFVKDASGKELGSQAFTLVEGKNSSASGNVITAPRGSNVSLTIKINKETKEAVIEKVDVTANTSDHSSAPVFVFILFGSAVLAAAAFLIRKRITA